MEPTTTLKGDMVPVKMVYDQAKFIEDREKQVRQLNSDAKEVHSIAGQMNEKIYQQDDKLDSLNKNMNNDLSNIQEANKELEQTRTITAARNKNLGRWTAIVVVLSLVLGLSIYFIARG